jgi:hypothetical protein
MTCARFTGAPDILLTTDPSIRASSAGAGESWAKAAASATAKIEIGPNIARTRENLAEL